MPRSPRRVNTQIKHILLYGEEVCSPYTDFDFLSWDGNKIEITYTQFQKRGLGCNIHTSNMMTRGDVGTWPLLIDAIKRIISHTNNLKGRRESIDYLAYVFETNNDIKPNFYTWKKPD